MVQSASGRAVARGPTGNGGTPVHRVETLPSLLGLSSAAVSEVCSNFVLPKEQQAIRTEELGLSRPYSDPRLRNRRTRVKLVRKLLAANLVELSLTDGVRVGVFSVWKKGKTSQRVIIDARISNACFSDPE